MKHFFSPDDYEHPVEPDPWDGTELSEQIPEPLYPFEHDVNTSDGSEFLDDRIRTIEQPYVESSEK